VNQSATKVIMGRVAWTAWAIVPVLALAFHFGPGQSAYKRDLAAGIIQRSQRDKSQADALQSRAYELHLAAIAARRAAFGSDDPALIQAAKNAGEAEAAAYATAKEAWQRTADGLGEALDLVPESSAELRARVRVARAHAVVRAGEIGVGAEDLEDLLTSMSDAGTADSPVGLQAREELATAYYYGARLLRLAGKPSEQWREVSGRARQNFRYLAEHARASSADADQVQNHEKNGELVLNLEQSSLDELYAKARPKDSPPGACERLGQKRPGRRGPRRGDQPSNGAGLDGEIGPGW
jgi:hypothetical protein